MQLSGTQAGGKEHQATAEPVRPWTPPGSGNIQAGTCPLTALTGQASCLGDPGAIVQGPTCPSALTLSPPVSPLGCMLERWPRCGSLQEGWWNRRPGTPCLQGEESPPQGKGEGTAGGGGPQVHP